MKFARMKILEISSFVALFHLEIESWIYANSQVDLKNKYSRQAYVLLIAFGCSAKLDISKH